MSGAVLNLLLAGSNSRIFCCCRAQLPPLLPHLTKAEQHFLYPLAIKTQFTQLFLSTTEVHTSDSISVAFEVPLQGWIFLEDKNVQTLQI